VPLQSDHHKLAAVLGMGILMRAGLQGTILGLRAHARRISHAGHRAGHVLLLRGVNLLGTLIAPRLLRRIGHVRVFAALAALASVASLVHASWVHPLPGAPCADLGTVFRRIYVVRELAE